MTRRVRPVESSTGMTHAIHHGKRPRDSDEPLLLVAYCDFAVRTDADEVPDFEEVSEDDLCGRCAQHLNS